MPGLKDNVSKNFKGQFITDIETMAARTATIKAYIFDWDGVFNDGYKNDHGSSPYSETDSMGTNLLRFSHFLRHWQPPVFAIITGEKNHSAFALSQRECFHSVYFKIKHKADALRHLCKEHRIQPEEVAFVYDDVLDLSVAKLAGMRFMVPHIATNMLQDFAVRNGWVDYITHSEGHHFAVREVCELFLSLTEQYDSVIQHRLEFSEQYRSYLALRNAVKTSFYSVDANNNIQPASI
jgi:3-deoxy-D-manno-octulosonate 8-phosphate phosphatase (KDO 8-P phosphatase)